MSTRIHLLLTVPCVLPLVFASCGDTSDVEEPAYTAEAADVVGDVRFETSCVRRGPGGLRRCRRNAPLLRVRGGTRHVRGGRVRGPRLRNR